MIGKINSNKYSKELDYILYNSNLDYNQKKDMIEALRLGNYKKVEDLKNCILLVETSNYTGGKWAKTTYDIETRCVKKFVKETNNFYVFLDDKKEEFRISKHKVLFYTN